MSKGITIGTDISKSDKSCLIYSVSECGMLVWIFDETKDKNAYIDALALKTKLEDRK